MQSKKLNAEEDIRKSFKTPNFEEKLDDKN